MLYNLWYWIGKKMRWTVPVYVNNVAVASDMYTDNNPAIIISPKGILLEDFVIISHADYARAAPLMHAEK